MNTKKIGEAAGELALGVTGGALAALIDVETPTHTPLSVPIGGWLGLGISVGGVLLSGGKHDKIAQGAVQVGGGMLAGEVYTATAAYVLKKKVAAASAAQTPAAGTVQGLPGGSVGASFSAQQLQQQINARVAAMRSNARRAA